MEEKEAGRKQREIIKPHKFKLTCDSAGFLFLSVSVCLFFQIVQRIIDRSIDQSERLIYALFSLKTHNSMDLVCT